MICEQSVVELQQYVKNPAELDAATRKKVEEHLATCGVCRLLVERYRREGLASR